MSLTTSMATAAVAPLGAGHGNSSSIPPPPVCEQTGSPSVTSP